MESAERPVEAEGAEQRLKGPWWWSERRQLTDEQRGEMLAQLYFEGPERGPFLARFATLLALSVLIAVFGIALDSTPVVIGAMLVSPLTTPILGLAAAAVMGWPRRQLESFLILAAGTAGGIGLAWLAMLVLPEPQAVTLASQELLARTTPRLLDLAVAVVAGSAGAYILVRREAVSALPGVAIAVALVPPLSVVGMSLELGRGEFAEEALLLYVSNLAGIVLSAIVVLILTGVVPRPVAGRLPRHARAGIGVAVLAVLAVAYPLATVTNKVLTEAVDQDDAATAAREWIGERNLELQEVRVDDEDRVVIEVAGPDRPPDPEPLAEELAREFDEAKVGVKVEWTKREDFTAEGRS